MIAGYVRNDFLNDALRVFDEMPEKDVVSWNLVIAALVNIQELDFAEQLFRQMATRDVASWTIVMSGLVGAGRIVEARICFDDMPIRDVQAWNTMISGYIKNRHVEVAEGLFHKMPEKDWNSWNEMIIRNGLVTEAHAFLEKTPFRDVVSQTNMIIGYFDIGEIGNAAKLFKFMQIRDTTAWNATIGGLGENDHGEDGLKLFIRMKGEGLPLDEATFTSILTICANFPSLDLGKQTHGQVIKMGINCFTSVCNAMLTIHAGLVVEGKYYFDFMKHDYQIKPASEHYTCIVDLLGKFGFIAEAVSVLDQMEADGVEVPASVLGALFGACRIHKNFEVVDVTEDIVFVKIVKLGLHMKRLQKKRLCILHNIMEIGNRMQF
ncbi:hypothetical protein RJ639_028123 [Escallonia herrerae]|uniref:Pentatricopeptide repeat-containing protein n=1 Tax=Escallonia herrerae TaxID=1293975 RepID=A0AA89BCX4_9ASTE|nr:hypothetical protein RJ639_028123 [Escallonia herrerae]